MEPCGVTAHPASGSSGCMHRTHQRTGPSLSDISLIDAIESGACCERRTLQVRILTRKCCPLSLTPTMTFYFLCGVWKSATPPNPRAGGRCFTKELPDHDTQASTSSFHLPHLSNDTSSRRSGRFRDTERQSHLVKWPLHRGHPG